MTAICFAYLSTRDYAAKGRILPDTGKHRTNGNCFINLGRRLILLLQRHCASALSHKETYTAWRAERRRCLKPESRWRMHGKAALASGVHCALGKIGPYASVHWHHNPVAGQPGGNLCGSSQRPFVLLLVCSNVAKGSVIWGLLFMQYPNIFLSATDAKSGMYEQL